MKTLKVVSFVLKIVENNRECKKINVVFSNGISGGTNITIRGINLGKEFLDIYGGITVAGIQCDPYESLYVKTEQIVCKVDGPGTKEPRRGPVIVKVADFRGESRDNYEFVDPQIRAIRPKRGPQSGKNKSVCLLLLVVVLVVTFISFTLALDFFVV